MLAARARNFNLARGLWERTRGAFDDTPAGPLLLSAIDFETGNEEQAARRLALLVADQPGNRRARRLLAAARWRMGDAAGTVEALRPIADRARRRQLYALADGPGAGAAGRRRRRLALSRPRRPAAAGRARPRSIRSSEGEFAAVRRAAADNPGDGPAQVRLISALLARGVGDEALARARRLQADNPGAPDVHILVGDALGIGGDFAAAAEQYRRAANLAFTEGVALRLIEALQRSGQADAADNVLRLFVQQNPRNVPALVLLAGREMQRSATGRSRSPSTRGCAAASAITTRPSSTISPGPIRKAATWRARSRSRAAPGRSTATIPPPPTPSAGSCSRAAAAPRASPCSSRRREARRATPTSAEGSRGRGAS